MGIWNLMKSIPLNYAIQKQVKMGEAFTGLTRAYTLWDIKGLFYRVDDYESACPEPCECSSCEYYFRESRYALDDVSYQIFEEVHLKHKVSLQRDAYDAYGSIFYNLGFYVPPLLNALN